MTEQQASAPATRPGQARAGSLRGDIEGMRAIAVLMVLLYHVQIPWIPGGFAGVDVFFVISGFLITNLLVKEATRTGRISLSSFYARRARRLLPAATVVLVFTAVAGFLVLGSGERAELGADVAAAAFYVVNWALAWRSVDYLAEDSDPSLVQHYWSLSVEEQFYLVWPLLIIVALALGARSRYRPTRIMGVVLLGASALSLLWSVRQTASSPETAYFVTTTRVWELGVGALLVFLTPRLVRMGARPASVVAALGVVAVGVSAFAFSSGTPWPGYAALLPTVGTALVIAAGLASQDTAVARALGLRPMRFVGALSYGLYLCHWPLLRLLEEARPDSGLGARLVVAALAVGLAWATLRLVEDPIRFSATLGARPRNALLVGALGMALSTVAGGAVWLRAPTVQDLPPTSQGALALVQQVQVGDDPEMIADPASVYQTGGEVFPAPGAATKDVPSAPGQECQVSEEETEVPAGGSCVYGPANADTTVAVVGDSKMLQWLPALVPIAEQEGWRLRTYTKSACGFTLEGQYEECHAYNAALAEHLARPANLPDVILTSLSDPWESIADELVTTLQPLQELGASVVFVADNPYASAQETAGEPSWYECVERHPADYGVCSYPQGPGRGTPALEQAHEQLDGSLFVDLSAWICPPGTAVPGAPDDQARCPSVIGEVLLYRQGSHLTATYVRTMTPLLHQALIRAGVATTPEEQVDWTAASIEDSQGSR